MEFNTVKIFPTGTREEPKWDFTVIKNDSQQMSKQMLPNGLGFYHYPTTVTDEDAFNRLKETMIKVHLDYIEGLKKSVDKLKELEYKKITMVIEHKR